MTSGQSASSRAGSFLCGQALFLMVLLKSATGAELRLEPFMVVREEYNSNVYLDNANEENDYITTLSPGINAQYRAPLWDWDLRYAFIERLYAQTDIGRDRTFEMALRNATRIIDDRVGILLNDEYSRVSLTPTRNYALESTFINQTDRNVFTVNPFVAVRPADRATVTAGYTYLNTWYEDPTAVDTVEHTRSLDVRVEATPRSTLNAVYRHARSVNRIQEYFLDELAGRVRYEYADRSALSGSMGVAHYRFQYSGDRRETIGDAVLSHRWSAATIGIEAGRQYIPDPQRVLRREDRTIASVNVEAERTTAQVTIGGRRYYRVLTGQLSDTSTIGTARISYSFTQQVRLSVNGTREHLKGYEAVNTNTLVMIKGLRIEGQPSESITTGLEYRYTTMQAHDGVSQNYRVALIMADVRYQF